MMGLQWTKLRDGATLHCNVDRLDGGGLDHDPIVSDHDLISLFAHDLFGKPVPTFPDHARSVEIHLLHTPSDIFIKRVTPWIFICVANAS
jgi:hypothetical protein